MDKVKVIFSAEGKGYVDTLKLPAHSIPRVGDKIRIMFRSFFGTVENVEWVYDASAERADCVHIDVKPDPINT